MVARSLQRRLAASLPFYYGWVILSVSALSSYSSRPVMAVATLSVFLVPMTEQFGWSRGTFSTAVSLGGICAVGISPLIGWWIDRHGSAAVVAVGGAVAGICALGISFVGHSWAFYALYVPGRMAFTSPLELGTSTAISNWFIQRRAFALALLNVTQGMGLAMMPLVAQLIISAWNWRTAWASLGIYTLSIAVLPALFLLVRRPEDLGLEVDPGPDRARARETSPSRRRAGDSASTLREEVNLTLRQALNTRAFWILAIFSGAGFMVQAGVSLHQAPHYLEQGLTGTAAAITVSVFALSQVPAGLAWSSLAQRMPIRFLLAISGLAVGAGAIATLASESLAGGVASAAILGVGVGGLHVLLRLAWADYYGRQYLGSIRGVTLPVQITGQALGPIISGFMYDDTGSYQTPFIIFAISASLVALLVLNATPPGQQTHSRQESQGT